MAYRYFSTPRRKFIIADTPGHEQYTRNMATGASTADLAIMLIDARQGVLPQSRRHAYIAALLGIRAPCDRGQQDGPGGVSRGGLSRDSRRFHAPSWRRSETRRSMQFIPLSALDGDNVVHRSARMPWYHGPALLEHLETVPVAARSQPRGSAFSGAVRDPAQPGLPWFRGPNRLGRDASRRPGDGAAVGPYEPGSLDRHLGRRTGRGVRAHVGHHLPGRGNRCQPGRHAGAPPRTRRTPAPF